MSSLWEKGKNFADFMERSKLGIDWLSQGVSELHIDLIIIFCYSISSNTASKEVMRLVRTVHDFDSRLVSYLLHGIPIVFLSDVIHEELVVWEENNKSHLVLAASHMA